MTELTDLGLKEFTYQVSMAVSAFLEGLGMFSENQKQPGKFGKKDFKALIDKYQLSHNQVLSNWKEVLQ